MSISTPSSAHIILPTAAFLTPVEKDLKHVDEALSRELFSSVKTVAAVASHVLEAGGKRLRPALVLLSAHACGGECDYEKLINIAAVAEMVHMATLVHDDVIDDADSRRGRVTANARWGNQISVLTGDYMVARAFSMLSRYADTRMWQVLSQATVSMTEGEISQLESRGNTDALITYYLSIIHDKTAVFISSCCQVGAMITGSDRSIEESLTQYGTNLGMAFQITDDLLDLIGDPKVIGKPVGGDIREGKITLPLILALERCNPTERASVERIIHSLNATPEEVEYLKGLAIQTGALEGARLEAKKFVDQAIENLSSLPQTEAREALISLAEYILNREK